MRFPPLKSPRSGECRVTRPTWIFDAVFLAILGRLYRAGGGFSTTVTAALKAMCISAWQAAGGLTFSLGLILVVLAGRAFYRQQSHCHGLCQRQGHGAPAAAQLDHCLSGELRRRDRHRLYHAVCRRYMFGKGIIWLNAMTISNAKCGNRL